MISETIRCMDLVQKGKKYYSMWSLVLFSAQLMPSHFDHSLESQTPSICSALCCCRSVNCNSHPGSQPMAGPFEIPPATRMFLLSDYCLITWYLYIKLFILISIEKYGQQCSTHLIVIGLAWISKCNKYCDNTYIDLSYKAGRNQLV